MEAICIRKLIFQIFVQVNGSFTNLNMTKLCYLNSRVGNRDRAASFQAVEEPLLNRVVVQWSVDVDWPNRSPVHISWLQQALCLELAFVSTLGVNCINLQSATYNLDKMAQKGPHWNEKRGQVKQNLEDVRLSLFGRSYKLIYIVRCFWSL